MERGTDTGSQTLIDATVAMAASSRLAYLVSYFANPGGGWQGALIKYTGGEWDCAGSPPGTAERRGSRPGGCRNRGRRRARAPPAPRRSVRGWAAGDGPWGRSPCRAFDRASWVGCWAYPWRKGRLVACRHGGPLRVGRGGAGSRLGGRGHVAEGLGSQHTGQVP